jgi:hypothetical protein
MGLITPIIKNKTVMKNSRERQTWKDSSNEQPKEWNMRLGTWNIRGLYRAGFLMIVLKELSRHNLDLMGVQEVRWGGGGKLHQNSNSIHIFLWKGE